MSSYLVHLVVSCNVFVQGPQQDHGNHARQEEDNDQGVHYAVKHTKDKVVLREIKRQRL